MEASTQTLSYLNIVVSEKGLSEFSDGRRIIFISKDQIQTIEFKFGPLAERPLVQGFFGILLLIGMGFAGFYFLDEGSVYGLRWGLGFILFGGLGAYMLFEALKRGYYFEVICTNDSRKLIFKGAIQKDELKCFMQNAGKFGYHFKNSPDDRSV